jgi:integrase
MAFIRMARPMRRDGSNARYFRERIPRDVLEQVRGLALNIPIADRTVRVRVSPKATLIKVSLRTSDDREAKARHAVVSTYLANVYRFHRAKAARSLTHEECVALAGEFYRGWAANGLTDEMMRKLGGPREAHAAWSSVLANWTKDADTGKAELKLAPLLDRFLMDRGDRIDEFSIQAVLAEAVSAMKDAFAQQEKRSGGDYSPDVKASRFPELRVGATIPANANGSQLTATALFDRWQLHADQKTVTPSTLASYSAVFARLRAFLTGLHGAEPAAADLTRDDIRAYIDMRSEGEGGVKPKTINAVDLGAINAVFNWAVDQDLLTAGNPAARIKRKARDAAETARKSLNDAEAAAILLRAFHYVEEGRESAKLAAAKRWVPWLLAYTGTRVGEVAQLRKCDVVKFDGHWAISVSKEAGTVKTKGSWHIPLHPHLIEQGFLAFVEAAPDGHLFLTPRPDLYKPDSPPSRTKDPRGILGPLQSLKNKLAVFAKQALPQSSGPTPAPNHGWRHRFKAQARKNGIDKEVRDAFADHASSDVAGIYGKDELFSAMVAALMKVPRYHFE